MSGKGAGSRTAQGGERPVGEGGAVAPGGETAGRAATPAAGTSLWRDAWRRLLRNRAAVGGAIVVLFFALLGLLYPLIEAWGTRFTVSETHLCLRNRPPGANGVPRDNHQFFSPDEVPWSDVDVDGNGAVTARELSLWYRGWEFARLDRDGDGSLDVVELGEAPRALVTDDLAVALAGYDVDRSGRVEFDEADALAELMPLGEAGVLVRARDRDGSASLSRDELPGFPKPRRFLLGTDGLGRDMAIRLVFGARVSLMVGLLATAVSFLIGVTWGAFAGYIGGRTDAVMMRVVDVLYGLPFMFLVILLMVVFGRAIHLLFIAIGAVSWLTMARIVRGQVISLREQEFVLAARGIGASTGAIVFRHLIPNALGPIIVYATLTVPAVMLTEAFLSFIGLGVQAPYTSWGALASEGAAPGVMMNYPWQILYPGGAMALTLLGLNFLGDGLRDALDPRMRKD